MEDQIHDNLFIITGPPGSGKSTILDILVQVGMQIVDEPARDIIDEQRIINGKGLYDQDKELFVELMISRTVQQYEMMIQTIGPVLFDRGIPDNIGYASLFGIDTRTATNAAKTFRYNKNVFFAPSWSEIYTTDQDRKISAEESKDFGEIIKQHYIDLGYNIIEIPKDEPANRAKFVLNNIFDLMLS